ncbi:hypothetical protein EDB82DRAFT_490804 [Fusarium venenatum]|uniref:uncharacterized protein n=1 Tax=Fusarium venenatum TaxID=56646 RepID=UPI001DA63FF6|nr:hypothetical protein EDB82DRAFT_490804 [Fusarium venenatum]
MFVAMVVILQITVTCASPACPITLHHLSMNHRNYLVLISRGCIRNLQPLKPRPLTRSWAPGLNLGSRSQKPDKDSKTTTTCAKGRSMPSIPLFVSLCLALLPASYVADLNLDAPVIHLSGSSFIILRAISMVISREARKC